MCGRAAAVTAAEDLPPLAGSDPPVFDVKACAVSELPAEISCSILQAALPAFH